ncbi:MAG: alcohol dehydrogenase catalytic domain-containing protein [Gammaproteobacteria bacterium]|nr:alcohol dehydrogenase catalytic domain-containing protein [Gammaproteobacteria bacterium]
MSTAHESRAGPDFEKLSVEDVTLEPPRSGEVMIRMAATGVCHSDLSVLHGRRAVPLPLALDTRESGVVLAVPA